MSASEDTARARDRATVDAFLRTDRESRLRRHTLYTEDGTAALFFTDVGRPLVVRGRENLRRHGELSLQVLPDWEWTDVEVYETLRPGLVLAECRGEGTIRFPGYPAGRYRNHFLHRFELVDGLIAASREYTNPIEHMRSLGIGTPHIDRDWIPTEERA
ncbi:PhzA/PhzB family protein [Streptomyces litmocidini]|uniref:PhzA/PhzB family protein n=1 Tax=Streptomyces litmocidini TaxID=67318 RepID=A0ABW7TZG4_9ACTN